MSKHTALISTEICLKYGKVTVMSLQAMSFMGHGLMRVNAKNLMTMGMGV